MQVSKPSKGKGSRFTNGCLEWVSESEYVEKGTWVGDNPEFCDIRARVMQGEDAHTKA